MNKYDACKILNLTGDINPDTVKAAYRRASMQYHPDRNPAGLEMMKAVNAAYEFLRDVTDTVEIKETVQNYGDDLFAAINLALSLGLTVEICGAWAWVHGDTRPVKDQLKEHGFKWAPKKKLWYFRPDDYKSFSRGKYSMDEIRTKYGSSEVQPRYSNRLTA